MDRGFLKGVVVGSATAIVVLMATSAFAGTGVGAVFNLGRTNSVDATSTLTGSKNGRMLQVTNTSIGGSATGIGINVDAGRPPLKVNSSVRVDHLNADELDGVDSTGFLAAGGKAADSDQLDGIDSTGFLHNSVPVALTGSDGNAVVQATNTGGGNGVQGITSSAAASGVYGENDDTGFGVAARAGGFHAAVYAENTGTGPAIELRTTGGNVPMVVNSQTRVANLNADMVDGRHATDFGHLVTNRLVAPSPNATLLTIQSMGVLQVASCTNLVSGSVKFDTNGSGNADIMVDQNGSQSDSIGTQYTSPALAQGFLTMNIARNTGATTGFVTIWVSWDADSCRFQAQALEHLAS